MIEYKMKKYLKLTTNPLVLNRATNLMLKKYNALSIQKKIEFEEQLDDELNKEL